MFQKGDSSDQEERGWIGLAVQNSRFGLSELTKRTRGSFL